LSAGWFERKLSKFLVGWAKRGKSGEKKGDVTGKGVEVTGKEGREASSLPCRLAQKRFHREERERSLRRLSFASPVKPCMG